MRIAAINKKGKIEFYIDDEKVNGKGIHAELKDGELISFVDGKKHVTAIIHDVDKVKVIKSKKELKKILEKEVEVI